MPYATLNGIRIHYDSHGEDDPVLLINGLSAPSANRLFQAFFTDPKQVDETVTRVLSFPFPTTAEAVQRQGQGILDWNGTRLCETRKIRVPTLVLVGRDDNLTLPAFSQALAGMIGKATLKMIPGGHGFTIEHWEDFNRAVLGFLRGVKR